MSINEMTNRRHGLEVMISNTVNRSGVLSADLKPAGDMSSVRVIMLKTAKDD